jgi:hypothetical protein
MVLGEKISVGLPATAERFSPSFGNLKDFGAPKRWYMPYVSVSALRFLNFNQKTLPLQHIGVNQFAAHPVAGEDFVHLEWQISRNSARPHQHCKTYS